MKTTFDQGTGIKTWHVEKWYQKTFYVLGVIFVILWVIGVLAGIFSGDY